MSGVLLVAGCRAKSTTETTPVASASAAVSSPVGAASSAAPAVASAAASVRGSTARPAPPVRQGSTIARSSESDALYVADEDHKALRVLALPLDDRHIASTELPGRPAQVLPVGSSVLVTIRDPGLLLVMRREEQKMVEAGRVKLPADAWGVAVTPDGQRAVVTSAWTHQVSVVDLATRAVVSTLDVRREPRGVVIEPDGKTAWVSHLVGAPLTRIEGIDGATPQAQVIALAPSPLRAPPGKVLGASLGYSLTLSPDGRRLYAPRHALGAQGVRHWYGAPTVDVLELPSQRSPIPARRALVHAPQDDASAVALRKTHGAIPFVEPGPMVQPRAVVYRASTDTLLVAAEGTDSLVEVDATSPEPGLMSRTTHELGREKDIPHSIHERCAAPSGVALSADEGTAYVFCRASYDVAEFNLKHSAPSLVRVADDPLGPRHAKGRRMFYTTGDVGLSGGLACAGCHPEGRDDGHTWHEVKSPETGLNIFVAEAHNVGLDAGASGFARQTPMIAGRLAAVGPYGWHAQNPTIDARLKDGFSLHRWDGAMEQDLDTPTSRMRAQALTPFLREGLVEPPRDSRPLTEQEQRGRALFLDKDVACATCHTPEQGFSNRVPYPLKALPTRATFAPEDDLSFKTPSLTFLAGTAPYYHDGSVPTLEALIDWNNDRMGKTSHLSKADRAALVAFLRTL